MAESGLVPAIGGFIKTSSAARASADNLIAVANVDPSKISDGIVSVLFWSAKVFGKVLAEINAHPELAEKMHESQVVVERMDFLHGMEVLYSILDTTGLLAALSKIGISLLKLIS